MCLGLHRRVGKNLKTSAVICGEKYGKIPIPKRMEEMGNRSTEWTCMVGQMRERIIAGFNAKAKMILV